VFPAEALTLIQHWRGVRERSSFVWLLPGDHDAAALAQSIGFAASHARQLNLLQEWGDVFESASPFANFVLRIMNPGSLDSFLPQLRGQISQVVQRPGCQGAVLAAATNSPDHLLGITYWEAERSFAQYMDWASRHPWKNTVDPVTLAVPLRMLTRRNTPSA
jgi:quinol monooxygenase YgiN